MIYNPKQMQELLGNIENYLHNQDLLTLKEFLWQYNKMYVITRDKIDYIKRKEKQWFNETQNNMKLITQNRELKNRIEQKKTQIEYLQKQIKELKNQNSQGDV